MIREHRQHAQKRGARLKKNLQAWNSMQANLNIAWQHELNEEGTVQPGVRQPVLCRWRQHTPNDHGDQENAAQDNHKRPGYITMKDPIQYRHACKVRKPTERVHSTHRISPTTKLVQANAENLGAPITVVKVD